MDLPTHFKHQTLLAGALGLVTGACQPEPVDWAEVSPPAPTVRRLTQVQYANAIRDVIGEEVVTPAQLEPDAVVAGFKEVGASVTTISNRGVEQYENASYTIAEQLVSNEILNARWFTCTPTTLQDADCAASILEPFAQALWRRPLTSEELDTIVTLSLTAAETLDAFEAGLVYGFAAVLQSPNFLFRIELGEPDPNHSGSMRYTDFEMASRLSFFLWNTTPDAELLHAAAAGELTTETGLEVQADRLLADPRARLGVAAFFTDLYKLYKLDTLSQDPTLFTHMSPDVGPSAREETLAVLEHLIFDEDADYRDLLTTRTTAVNRTLAAIYDIPAPTRDGFGWTEHPEDSARVGLLGHASFLTLNAHPVSTSATLRGMFVREILLCQHIPLPPAGVDTSIPEPSSDAKTLRERVAQHLEDEYCATCHQITDPIGLSYEQFDAIGRFRTQDNGARIDPSGAFDGEPFPGPSELSSLIRSHERLGPCLVKKLHTYATGHEISDGEELAIDALSDQFKQHRFRVLHLLKRIVLNPSFRKTTPVNEEAPS